MTSGGVALARQQLTELAEISGGAVTVLKEDIDDQGVGRFTVSLDTSRIEVRPTGIDLQQRERFKIVVDDGFPFEPPIVFATHRRWARTPHVQWGSFLCIYAAASVEWNPSDGMRGFIDRLSQWIDRAAAGTLDPDGQPLHPPAVSSSLRHGTILIHPDLGDRVPWAVDGAVTRISTLIAWCAVESMVRRVDVLEWTDIETARARAGDTSAEVFNQGLPVIALPVVLLADEFGFTYPNRVKELSAGLAASGYDHDRLVRDLAATSFINRTLRAKQRSIDATAAGQPWDDSDDEGRPLLTAMLVGTPSRRVEGDARLAHLACWKLDSLSGEVANLIARAADIGATSVVSAAGNLAEEYFERARIAWMRVMEMRPEVTQRRDQGTPSNWLQDKRVLVLGAGALGAPISEFCVRGGVAELTVVDKGIVTPGIIVRQPYIDDDIGWSKAYQLTERLSTVRKELKVTPLHGDVRTTVFGDGKDLDAFDLVIDATADVSVRSVLEQARKNTATRPPLVTVIIGHTAEHGLVTTNLTDATGAGADALRKVSLLAASGRSKWRDVIDEFFPATPRQDLFFPEPGCSEPTFVGSAAQTSALAGFMLNEALAVLTRDGLNPRDSSAVSFASAVRIGSAEPGTSRAEWIPDAAGRDESGAFEIRVNMEALAEARAEVRRGARVRGELIETGGMLLGSFDDATGIVFVDRMIGPPPDSYLSETYFQHGLLGVQDHLDSANERTGGTTGFVGFWHTHPSGSARPSPTDEQGMASIVGPDGTKQRALMMILGGPQDRWTAWRNGVDGQMPDIYARVVPRSAGPVLPGHPGYVGGRDLQQLPPGTYFRGGYGKKVRVAAGVTNTPSSARPAGKSADWWSRWRSRFL